MKPNCRYLSLCFLSTFDQWGPLNFCRNLYLKTNRVLLRKLEIFFARILLCKKARIFLHFLSFPPAKNRKALFASVSDRKTRYLLHHLFSDECRNIEFVISSFDCCLIYDRLVHSSLKWSVTMPTILFSNRIKSCCTNCDFNFTGV